MEDNVVLNYGDSLLRESDVALLQSGQWLNDKIISFMFEYYQTELYASDHANNDILFLDADVVQLVKLMPKEEVEFILSTLNLGAKRFIFLPVNDNQSVKSGGSHWSLLVWDKSLNCFEHYDSIKNSGLEYIAKDVCNRISQNLAVENYNFINIQNTPLQQNQYDCGMYVIKLAKIVCDHKLQNSSASKPLVFSSVVSSDIEQNGRRELKSLISKLSKKNLTF